MSNNLTPIKGGGNFIYKVGLIRIRICTDPYDCLGGQEHAGVVLTSYTVALDTHLGYLNKYTL